MNKNRDKLPFHVINPETLKVIKPPTTPNGPIQEEEGYESNDYNSGDEGSGDENNPIKGPEGYTIKFAHPDLARLDRTVITTPIFTDGTYMYVISFHKTSASRQGKN
jgi:hypothetical protein